MTQTMKSIDTSWMNENVLFRGGLIVGKSGSGKTNLIKFIALSILELCPEVNLKFYNPHYIKSVSRYFPEIDQEQEESLFITDFQEILMDAEKCYAELAYREQKSDSNSYPVVRILQETKSLAIHLGNDYDRLICIMRELKDRGRKYSQKVNGFDSGFSVWLLSNDFKQEVTKINSEWYESNSLFLLGNSIYQAQNSFFKYFDLKALGKSLEENNKVLEADCLKFSDEPHKDLVRACVYFQDGGKPQIKNLPKL